MPEELVGYDYVGQRKVPIAVTPDGKLRTDSDGGGSGGSSLDQAGVQAAIQAATNLNDIEAGLAAILDKLSVDPATQTTLESVLTTLDSVLSQLNSGEPSALAPSGFRSAAALSTSGVLLTANPARKTWTCPNTTGVNLYARYDGVDVSPTPGEFVHLVPPGGQLSASGAIAQAQVRVIAPGAAGDLTYSEGF